MARSRTPQSLPMAPLGTLPPPERCPLDGGTLRSGFCLKGGGYPYWTQDEHGLLRRPCPFVCPLCRGPLDWQGGCERCHGCTTGHRGDWTFPGDRFDRADDDGRAIGDGWHWVRTDGPRAAISVEENSDCLRATLRVLAAMPALDSKPDRRALPEKTGA